MIKKKFDSLFYFEPKSKIKAGAGHNKGQYPFYTSSGNLTKKVEIAQYAGNSRLFVYILVISFGCGVFYYVKLYQNVHVLPFCLIIDFQIFVYLKL